jgi:PAS domain S-box-containing protein
LGEACGVKDFIPKPSEPEKILETVNRVLGLPAAPLPLDSPLPARDPIPGLIDAFYEKGKQLDTVSMRLAALLDLGLQMSQSSLPQELLEKTTLAARKIIGADYAAAGTVEGSSPQLRFFVTSGMSAVNANQLNHPAVEGTLRQIIVEGRTLRAFSRVGDPVPVQLPVSHPLVRGFLGTPIRTRTRTYGLIYLASKLGGVEFTLEDERILATVAAKLAIAYENIVRYQDIQEQTAKLEREVEQRKHAEERFRLLIETAPTGILICDGQGRITEGNAQLQRMFGYTREELLGQPIEILVPEQHRGGHVGHRSSYINTPQARPMGLGMELRGRRKDGTTFPVEISLGPLATDEGMQISSTVVDISERKKLEQQLQTSHRLEAVGQLAAGIAHDFNNILTAISGNTKLALDEVPRDHPVQRNLAEIGKASSRATKLIRQILTFSRQQESQRQVIQLAPVIEEVLKLLRATLPANIEIHPDFRPDVPSVSADTTQMHQILMNLATNAAHAMPQGGVLSVQLEAIVVGDDLARTCAGLHEGFYVRMSIADQGCGMSPATIEHIFEPFFTTKPQGEGTGLGLSVVHGIMKTHGGAITVYSEPGKGTVFHLYLPAARGATEVVQPRSQVVFRGRGQRVLYVDDEEPLVLLMTLMLEKLGYKVTGCTAPESALKLFGSTPQDFDVVVSDLSMPRMSGVDLARDLLRIRPGIPILIASGYIRPADNEAVRSLGLPDLILKPDTVEQLGDILHELFESNKGPEGLEKSGEEHTAPRRQAASFKG